MKRANPWAHLCAYGLYAPLNEPMLRRNGVDTVIGGEFEQALADGAPRGEGCGPSAGLPRTAAVPGAGSDRPAAARRATRGWCTESGMRRVGYTEASRGCKHLCRHCPVVPVYRGVFRIVQPDVVLEDIRRQVAAGAEHITFGDPDFFNGPGHAHARSWRRCTREWPGLTYDVTIKVEHLLRHRDLLPVLQRTGCLFVTSAVESLDDAVLETAAEGPHARGLRRGARLDARRGTAALAHVHSVHAVDDTRELPRIPAGAGRDSAWRTR